MNSLTHFPVPIHWCPFPAAPGTQKSWEVLRWSLWNSWDTSAFFVDLSENISFFLESFPFLNDLSGFPESAVSCLEELKENLIIPFLHIIYAKSIVSQAPIAVRSQFFWNSSTDPMLFSGKLPSTYFMWPFPPQCSSFQCNVRCCCDFPTRIYLSQFLPRFFPALPLLLDST